MKNHEIILKASSIPRMFLGMLFLIFFLNAKSQSWLWGKQGIESAGSRSQCFGDGLTADSAGNVFLAGTFGDTISFGSYRLTNERNAVAFIAKYSPTGNVLWAKQSKPTLYYYGYSSKISQVTTDVAGNAYVSGSLTGYIVFGQDTLKGPKNTNASNGFLVKYDPNGNVLWARMGVGASFSSRSWAYSTSADRAGNVYLCGNFMDTVSFGSRQLVADRGLCMFLVKYNRNGNVIWARQTTSPSKTSGANLSPFIVSSDISGNAYVSGNYTDTIIIGSTLLQSFWAWKSGAFIAKYDSSGNVLWAQSPVNTGKAFGGVTCRQIASDISGNVYMTGEFADTTYFGSHKVYIPAFFLTKYDRNGNVLWAKSCQDTTEYMPGSYLGCDVAKNVYVTAGSGSYRNSPSVTTFNFNGDTLVNATPRSCIPALIMKLDSNGKPLCATLLSNGGQMGYSGNGLLVTSTPDGKYVYAGGSQDTCGGLTVLGNDTLKRFGPICPFVTRWEACSHTAGILNLSYQLGQSRVYPNPNTGTFVIEFKSEVPVSRLEIYNVFGGIIYNTKTVPSNSLLRIDLGSCSSGLYFYRLFNDVGQIAGCGKIIIQH